MVLVPLPMFHIFGLVIGMLLPPIVQAKVLLMASFDLIVFLESIQKYKVTRSFVVPPIVLALAKHPIVDNYDFSSLETLACGAAPVGEDTAKTAMARLQCRVKQGWGMTELSPVRVVFYIYDVFLSSSILHICANMWLDVWYFFHAYKT